MSPPLDDDGRLFRTLFETASDGMLVTDDHGLVLFANAACERLLGYDPGGLVGLPVEALVPDRFQGHAAHRRRYAAEARPRAMGAGIALVARHHDGHDVPVDIALTPLERAGRPVVLAAIRDMRGSPYAGDTLRVQATALRSAANGVVITDRQGVITWVNPAACAITGYSAEDLVGQHTRILKSGEHAPEFYRELWRTVARGETWSGTIVNRRKDGSTYDEEQSIAPVVDESGALTHFIAIKQDVTERRRTEAALARAQADLAARVAEIEALNKILRDQAIRDPLTGLFNRRYFDESIARDLAAAARAGEPVALLAVDVDHFKLVNDSYGHPLGDRLLQALAGVLGARVRSSDLACRFGGEEFVVVLTGATLPVALRRAEAIRRECAALRLDAGTGTPVRATVSVGVAVARGPDEPVEVTLARADEALYAAKRAGRDRVVAAPA